MNKILEEEIAKLQNMLSLENAEQTRTNETNAHRVYLIESKFVNEYPKSISTTQL